MKIKDDTKNISTSRGTVGGYGLISLACLIATASIYCEAVKTVNDAAAKSSKVIDKIIKKDEKTWMIGFPRGRIPPVSSNQATS
ncbi:hypothetical protein [Gloeobacter morelensis]|uniref:hypothetical protein n=1 Tax=Gloeobacter morelensis TaxID=2907343 RepID=UPI001E302EF1|nr:hypothetical protein [Gloeobacter morelensis]UFP97209.1 hypothetical protein ISF26_24110 [Gloeobacter morelensis MG652769]